MDILPHIKGGTVLYWTFAEGTELAVDAKIKIEVARHDTVTTAAWTTLATVDASLGIYTDTQQRTWGSNEQVYYRLTLDTPLCVLGPYPSMMGMIPCEMQGLLREILRRERQRHQTKEAQRGALLKRKYSGVVCPTCVDPDFTERQIRSDCPTCFATGWTGGYYLHHDFYVDMGNYGGANAYGEETPVVTGGHETKLQFLNIPDIQPGDVWVDYQSDHRWMINSTESLLRIGSYVVTAAAAATRLNFADVVYAITVAKPTG
jgi:hypothetical protein